MNFFIYWLVTPLIFNCVLTASQNEELEVPAPLVPRSFNIKVLLEEANVAHNPAWKISCGGGVMLCDPVRPINAVKLEQDQLDIQFHDDAFYINNNRCKKQQFLLRTTNDNHLACNNKEYQGQFLLTKYGDVICLVNILDLEDYVYSVLRTESWPGWPLEVNKALAIACRTYAIAMVNTPKKNQQPFHIRNTNKHQTYTGYHINETLKEAVEQTKGVFLSYNNAPIVAMFDCCCGGIVPAHITGFDFQKAPYLARPYACTFCKKAKIYRWVAEFECAALEKLLSADIPQGMRLKDIRIQKKDKAGYIHEIQLRGHRSTNAIAGKRMYSVCKKIKSFCYSVKRKGSKIIFNGRGYGHHMGLCQWGARAMVDDGWDYKGMLLFYYPGTTLMSLV